MNSKQLIVTALLSLLLCTGKSMAEAVEDGTVITEGDFKYTVLSAADRTVKAEGGYSPTDLVIPDYISIDGQDYKVIEIGRVGSNFTQSVKLPAHLRKIGKEALGNCTEITSIVLPESLKVIGESAFRCEYVTEISLPAALDSIGKYAFWRCGFKSIDIPDNVTYVGDEAFGFCPELSTVAIGKNAVLGNNLFNGCDKLRALTLRNPERPETTEKAVHPFFNFTDFSVYVPDGSLEKYRVDERGNFWKEPVYMYEVSDPHEFKALGIWYTLRETEKGERKVTVINSLGEDYKGSVIIPETVIRNGEELQCTAIAGSAFKGCTKITDATISASVKEMGTSVFEGCTSLTAVTLPETITSVPQKTFYGCKSLTSFFLPSRINEVEASAFANTNIENINFNYLNKIGQDAFRGAKLKEIRLKCPEISLGAFEYCPLEYVALDEGVEEIGASAFNASYGFNVSGSIKVVNLPQSIKNIAEDAFSEVDNVVLNSPTPPDLGRPFAISATSALYVPEGTRDLYAAADYWKDFPIIREGTYESAFEGMTTVDGVKYIIGNDSEAIANGFTDGISGDLKLLSEVEIGGKNRTVVKIADSAFAGCKAISSVTIPSAIKEIGESAFADCINITSIDLGEGVETVGANAFQDAIKVQMLTLPASLKTIGAGAFGWQRLAVLVMKSAEPPVLTESPFHDFDADSFTTLFVPEGSKQSYAVSDVWRNFKHMLEYSGDDYAFGVDVDGMSYWPINDYEACCILKDNLKYVNIRPSVTINGRTYRVTTLPVQALSTYGQGIKGINIPYGVTTIGSAAVMMQVCLFDISIPNSVTSISDYAFYYCELVRNVTIGTGVRRIGDRAFSFCTSLHYLTSNNPVPPALGENVFDRVNVDYCILRVPAGSKERYQNAPQWCDFANIEEFGAPSIFDFGDNVYIMSGDGQVALSSANPDAAEITIPSTITVTLDPGMTSTPAARRANMLESTYDVTSIARDAFIGCTNLKKLTFESPQPPFVLNDCFPDGIRENCELIVPAAAIDLYKSSPMWEEFANVHAPDVSGIAGITDGAPLRVFDGGIRSVSDGLLVEVFTVDGCLVARKTLDSDETLSLPANFYIIRADGRAFKTVMR